MSDGTKPVVIDTSVLLAFYLPAEPYKAQALALLGEATAGQLKFVVPTLTHYEVLNVLSRALRGLRPGQELSHEDVKEILKAIEGLKLEEHDVKGLEERILEIASQHRRSAYDAAYLALAERVDADFLTGDRRLYNALKAQFERVKYLGNYPHSGPANSTL